MSMAERKRKQKWSLNPRGKAWAEDTNKFGHKMLEKMGWSQGKGLGANEDGMLEHIKVSHKNDSKGIGYKETDGQWTTHESNFSALLEALGGGEQKADKIKLNSLEEKSQNSRARVHYKKFTRGKDLSKYSEKDLANIFGKKDLKELKNTKKERVELQEESLQKSKEENDSSESEKSRFFSNGGLISDYFKKRLPNFGKINGYVVGNNGVLKKDDNSESECEKRPSFGFGFKQESVTDQTIEEEGNTTFIVGKEDSKVKNNFIKPIFELGFRQESLNDQTIEEEGNITFVISKDSKVKSNFTSYIYENDTEVTPEKKKKNRKKRNLVEDSSNTEDTPSKKKKLEPDNVREDTPVKNKKDKSKKTQHIEEQSGFFNPVFDPFHSPVKTEKRVLEPIEESPNESLNDTVGQVAESFEVKVQINNECTPVKKRSEEGCGDDTIKRNKIKKDNTEDMDISYQLEGSLNKTLNEIKKKKKKKVKDIEEAAVMNTSRSGINKTTDSNENYINITPKKDKKRKKTKTNSIERLDMVSAHCEEQPTTPKKKKSKTKDSQEGIDNPFFNMSIESEESMVSQSENPYEVKIKEKKKKKKRREEKENYAHENPVFNEEDSMGSQDIFKEEFEVKRKGKSKKKKKDKEENKGLDNPALNLNDSIDESCDLMLNVVATPVISKDLTGTLDNSLSIKKITGVKRRKSVRFSDVTRERIIPNKDEMEEETLEDSRDIIELEGKLNDSSELSYIDKFIQKKRAKKRKQGLDNSAFDRQANSLEENITSISKTLDTYEAEIENDMNEAKLKSVEIEDIMVGEVGNPDGTNEILSDGTVKLKFKNVKFNKSARYIDGLTGAKKAYKHLIKGDIVMSFKETNLHEIEGYAVRGN